MTEKAPMSPAQRMAIARAAKASKASRRATALEEMPEVTADDVPEGWLQCRVLRHGDGRIATGDLDEMGHTPEERFPCYARNDHVYLPPDNAAKYEEMGWVEYV